MQTFVVLRIVMRCIPTTTSSASVSVNPKREPTIDENKLAQLLLERVVPPFSRSLKLKALVVYQADQEEMNCLLVDKAYSKNHDCDSTEEIPADFSDSGFFDTSVLTPVFLLLPESRISK